MVGCDEQVGAQAGAVNPGLAICLVCDLFFGPQFSHSEMREWTIRCFKPASGGSFRHYEVYFFNVI